MNAVKNCVAEFAKIHMQHLKFQQQLELLDRKHQYKMKEMVTRKEIYANENSSDIDKPKDLISWDTDGAVGYLQFLKNKQKKD